MPHAFDPADAPFDETGDDPIVLLEVPAADADGRLPAAFLSAGIEVVSTALRDPQVRVIVLALRAAEPAAPAGADGSVDATHDLLWALADSDKPTLAALEGPIGGTALGLALACDLLVGSQTARLQLAVALQRAGRCAAATWQLARRLPPQQAMAMALGCEIDAARAHALGLLHELTPPALARERALALARRIAATPARDLLEARRQLARCASQTLAQHLDEERARWLLGQG